MDLIIIYPKPYSIFLGATISPKPRKPEPWTALCKAACAKLSPPAPEPEQALSYSGYGGFLKIMDTVLGGPYNKDYSVLGSMLGCPYLGKLPYKSPA